MWSTARFRCILYWWVRTSLHFIPATDLETLVLCYTLRKYLEFKYMVPLSLRVFFLKDIFNEGVTCSSLYSVGMLPPLRLNEPNWPEGIQSKAMVNKECRVRCKRLRWLLPKHDVMWKNIVIHECTFLQAPCLVPLQTCWPKYGLPDWGIKMLDVACYWCDV